MKVYRCHIILFLLLDCATHLFSQSIDFVIDGKVDILVVDPSGRRYGLDRTTGNTYTEIPNVGIGSAAIGILNPVTGEVSVDSAMLDLVDGSIHPPLNGKYQFVLQGKTNCITYVSPLVRFSNGDRVNNGAIGSIIDSNMTVTINLYFVDNNSGQTFLKKQIDEQYLIKSLDAMRAANWIFNDLILNKYVSLVDTFYSFLAQNSIVQARLTLSTILQNLQVDSISRAVDKKVLVDLSKDINQLILDLPHTPSNPIFNVKLVNSSGSKLIGGSLQYYEGSWKDAINNNDGTFSINTTQHTLSLRMTYAYGVQTKSNVAVGSDTVVFQTVNAQVKLQNSQSGLIDTVTVQYYAGAWRDFGTTVNGIATRELLPVNYSFRMTYAFASNDKAQDLSTNSTVTFQTVNSSVQLKDSQGNLIDQGTVQYYSGAWRNFGVTSSGIATKELLPNNYSFRMTYAYASNDKQQDLTNNPTVVFQTMNAIVQLKNSQGNLIDTGTVQYYSGAWRAFGTTTNGAIAKELLPNNYSFRMTYAFASNDKQQNIGTNSTVVFNTVNASVQLKNSQGSLIDQGTVQYYSGAWRDFGATTGGTTAKELLPTSYQFRMTYAYVSNDKTQDVGSNNIVSYSTVLTTVRVKDAQSNPVNNAVITYYSGTWRQFGNTVNGDITKELLPANLQFRAKLGSVQQDKTQNLSANPLVEISLNLVQ